VGDIFSFYDCTLVPLVGSFALLNNPRPGGAKIPSSTAMSFISPEGVDAVQVDESHFDTVMFLVQQLQTSIQEGPTMSSKHYFGL